MKRYIPQSPYQLELMEFRRIEEHIERFPALLLPVSGPAPLGNIPVGAEMQCSLAIADLLSLEHQVVSAPLLPFAQGICFQEFGGCVGLHIRHWETMVGDLIKGWALQGFTHFFVVRSVWPIPEQFSSVVKRLQNRFPNIECHLLDWRRDSVVRGVIASHCSSTDDPRSEIALIQLLNALGLLKREDVEAPTGNQSRLENLVAWKKRGHDPRKFRILSPQGRLLGRMDSTRESEWGEDLLHTILDRFGDTIRSSVHKKNGGPGSQ